MPVGGKLSIGEYISDRAFLVFRFLRDFHDSLLLRWVWVEVLNLGFVLVWVAAPANC
jgi:hypothetical protein